MAVPAAETCKVHNMPHFVDQNALSNGLWSPIYAF
jgi:hypothetical protein